MSISFSPELAILILFARERANLAKYAAITDKITFDTDSKIIYDSIKTYYNEYPEHEYIGQTELSSFIDMKYSMYKDLPVLKNLVTSMFELEVSSSFCKSVVDNLIERDVANTIINKLMPVLSENKFGILDSVDEDLDVYKNYKAQNSEEKEIFINTPLADLLVKYDPQSKVGLKWRLPCLQENLGPLVGDTLIHIVSRPEVGKTAFLACEATNFAMQLQESECILWVNNEESSERILLRTYMSLLKCTTEDLTKNIEQSAAKYNHFIGKKLRIVDEKSCPMTIEAVTRLVKELRPKILIIDHADKLTFQGAKHMDIPVKLRELYNRYRALGKMYDIPILVVGHCNQEAEGKKWITFDMLDYSRTGKAAEIDVLLGIGMTHKEEEEGIRFLSAMKNKLTGKHFKETVSFDPKTARYSTLG